jgi:hypothetical protein
LGSVAGDGEILASVVISVPFAAMARRFLSGIFASTERYELKQPLLKQNSQPQKHEWQNMDRPEG